MFKHLFRRHILAMPFLRNYARPADPAKWKKITRAYDNTAVTLGSFFSLSFITIHASVALSKRNDKEELQKELSSMMVTVPAALLFGYSFLFYPAVLANLGYRVVDGIAFKETVTVKIVNAFDWVFGEKDETENKD